MGPVSAGPGALMVHAGDLTRHRPESRRRDGYVASRAAAGDTLEQSERFDPDWQQPFASVFGDVLGVQIAKGLAAALQQARIAGRNLAESAAEYVTEESRDVVPRAELDAFHDDVDVLRDDVERMAARIARLRLQVRT